MSEHWTAETSGSIDLRALRAALGPVEEARDERDEIARIVTHRDALVALEIPPVREPTARRPVLASLAAATTLLASLVAFAAVPTGREGAPRDEIATVVERPAPVVPAERKLEAELSAPEPALEPPAAPELPATPRERPRVARLPSAPARVAPTPATPAPAAPAPPSIDPALAAALDAALSGGRAAAPAEILPATPPQHEVRATLRGLERAVAQCREGEGGLVEVRLAIEGASGRVASADVRGEAARGAVARCVEGVVLGATFSRFERDRLAVTYPFRL